MYKNYKVFENQHPKIQKYIDFVDQEWPYRFFATLTFQHALTDREGIDFASEHIKRFNRRLLGRNWAKVGVPCMTGVATLERSNIQKKTSDGHVIRHRGTCHFHYLLHDHACLDKDPIVALRQVTEAWEAAARSLNYKRTRKLVSYRGTNVQLFQTTGLYGYILKEAKNPGWKHQERLFFLDGKGLIWIDASVIKTTAIRTL